MFCPLSRNVRPRRSSGLPQPIGATDFNVTYQHTLLMLLNLRVPLALYDSLNNVTGCTTVEECRMVFLSAVRVTRII
nr:hypothetical protein [Tanacetum cinerariifolium]